MFSKSNLESREMKWFKKSLRLRLNDLKIEFKTKIFADNFLSLGNVVRFLAVFLQFWED